MKSRVELIAPCHFGMEAVCKREITDLGYDIVRVEDGKVTFAGGADALVRANIFLRTTQRILWKVGEFKAVTFEELFQGIKDIPWEDYLPRDARFWVTKATSVKSTLFSTSDIQSIAKMAMVERMKELYHVSWFEENGQDYPVRISLYKDVVTVALDVSGESLHKRGYRKMVSKAPLEETLAAGLIRLTPWNRDRILVDPFCGSGTFPIEAAMMGANIAPGMHRAFQGQQWENLIPVKLWQQGFEEAEDLVDRKVEMDIQGYDIDPQIIKAARENAKRAGVDQLIHFQQRPIHKLRHPKKYGFVITNPPYGERMEDKEDMPILYREMGEAFSRLDGWSEYVITAYEDAEKYIGKKADRNRKIYNGMMKTYFYQFMGPKPPRRKKTTELEGEKV
ncbi:MAG: class I SAM-dependent RNA methyltransferase [Clostridiales bacterium]|nr:class I SAM-dependent RNA methyltransferase [Clostridiales bacterium]